MTATGHREHLADARRKADARAFVDAVLAGVPIEAYGVEVAVAMPLRVLGVLTAPVERDGLG